MMPTTCQLLRLADVFVSEFWEHLLARVAGVWEG